MLPTRGSTPLAGTSARCGDQRPEHSVLRAAAVAETRGCWRPGCAKPRSRSATTAHTAGQGRSCLVRWVRHDASTISVAREAIVIADDAFGQASGSVVQFNDEGEIADDAAAESVPFTETSVDRMLSREPTASLGAACLALAWKHGGALLGV